MVRSTVPSRVSKMRSDGLDILLNSAGVSARNAMPEGSSPEDIWDKVIDVNLKGTYLASWYAAPEMVAEKSGSTWAIRSSCSQGAWSLSVHMAEV